MTSVTIVGGKQMPLVGLGTYTVTDEAQLIQALDVALEAGYRHIDTAALYFNEHVIGNVLKRWFESGKLKREDIFITTKLPPNGNFADKVEHFLKRSLEALQLDYVDLYLIHNPVAWEFNEVPKFGGPPVPVDHLSLWKGMEAQIDAGRTKAIGISNFNLRQTKRIYENARIKPACNQFELHPYFQRKELVDYCQSHNIAVTGFGSLGNPGINTFYKRMGWPTVKLFSLFEDETIKQISAKYNKTPAQIILRYFVQKKVIMIPKSTTPERIRQNFNIFDFSLGEEDFKAMENLDQGEAGRLDRQTSDAIKNHPEYPHKN